MSKRNPKKPAPIPRCIGPGLHKGNLLEMMLSALYPKRGRNRNEV